MSDRPLCKCHGEPMHKQRDRFRCAVKNKEQRRRHYEANREKELGQRRRHYEANREKELERYHRRYLDLQWRGLCTRCGKEPLLSESRCWDCLNRQEEGRFVSAL